MSHGIFSQSPWEMFSSVTLKVSHRKDLRRHTCLMSLLDVPREQAAPLIY